MKTPRGNRGAGLALLAVLALAIGVVTGPAASASGGAVAHTASLKKCLKKAKKIKDAKKRKAAIKKCKRNHPPAFPDPMESTVKTSYSYDPNTGYLSGATTEITFLTPATDPDGDPIKYEWSATNGSIVGNGLSATWTRVIESGSPAAGDVTITASDGRGGSDRFTLEFTGGA